MHDVAADRPVLPSYLLHAVQRGDVLKGHVDGLPELNVRVV